MLAALLLAGVLGTDWLLDPSAYVASATKTDGEVTLDNGLVRRTLRLKPSPATVKDHRRVLTGDLIHLRRPDGRDWDGWLKVDPQADEKAMAFLFNPTRAPIEREIRLPLYYAGLTDRASISVNGAAPVDMPLDRACRATVRVTIPAEGYVWVLAK